MRSCGIELKKIKINWEKEMNSPYLCNPLEKKEHSSLKKTLEKEEKGKIYFEKVKINFGGIVKEVTFAIRSKKERSS